MDAVSWLNADFIFTNLKWAITLWFAMALVIAREIGDEKKCEKLRNKYAEDLDPRPWRRYQAGLMVLLDRIDHFFGFVPPGEDPSLFRKPWRRCSQLALIYPLFFFLLTYLFASRGDFAGIDLLGGEAPALQRAALVGWILLIFWLFYIADKMNWFKQIVQEAADAFERITQFTPQLSFIRHALKEGVSFFFGAFAFSSALIVAFAFSGANADAVAVTVAFAGAVAVAGAVTGAISIAIAVAGFLAFVGPGAVLIMTFFVLFPIVNSLLDWVSILATRKLMKKWVSKKIRAGIFLGRYLTYTLIDLAIAILCICILSFLMTIEMAGLTIFLSWLLGGDVPSLDWMATMRSFRDDPLGDGLMITLMLFSTLIPTAFHLVAGLVAAVKLPNLGKIYVMRNLEGEAPAVTDCIWIACVIAGLWLIPMFLILALVGHALRFFFSLAWIKAPLTAVLDHPPEWLVGLPDDPLLIWLPYKISEMTRVALGGAVP